MKVIKLQHSNSSQCVCPGVQTFAYKGNFYSSGPGSYPEGEKFCLSKDIVASHKIDASRLEMNLLQNVASSLSTISSFDDQLIVN